VIIDSHAHLDFESFHGEVDAVLQRAREAGVGAVVSIGIDLDSCRRTAALARDRASVFAALGIHPNEAGVSDEDFRAFVEVVRAEEPVAIGETGLDYYRDTAPRAAQERRFRQQIALARELGLPIIVHCREAYDDLLAVLRDEDFRHGVCHCFGGEAAHADALVEHGFHVSFAGPVTFPKAEALRATVPRVPLDRLLLETDSPFLAPQPVRGQRNEPAYVRHTAEVIAGIHGVEVGELERRTTENAVRLFSLPLGA